MKKLVTAVVASGLLVFPISCATKQTAEIPPEKEKQIVQIGSSATKKLLKTLKGELIKGLKKGPVNAVDVCSKKALELTKQVEKELDRGIEIKRTSLRYRNPKNAPDIYEREALEYFEKFEKEKKPLPKYYLQKVEKNGKVYYRFYKPLKVLPVCLTCHGKLQDMDPKLQTKLLKLYPGDQAINYEEGDFRGVVRVSIPEDALR
ncbi:Tll0287-like domain-containing protein [Persephonella sp.]